MRIIELKNQFLNYLVEYRGRKIIQVNAYDFDLTKFINYLQSIGVADVNSVGFKTIEEYLFHLKCSTTTKARVRSSIKSFFYYLSRKEHISNNPTTNLESMKLPEKSPEYLSHDQQMHLLKTIEKDSTPFYKDRDLMLVRLFLKTGLRRA